MLKSSLFFLLLAIFAGSILVTIDQLFDNDPFLLAEGNLLVNNPGITGPVLGQIKRRHGQHNKPYQVGIFGSSVSMMLTAKDLGTERCSFFNFSVLGESLRGTVSLMYALANNGKLPKTVIVGIDNFEVHSYGNSRTVTLTERISEIHNDIMVYINTPDIRFKDMLRMMLRHVIAQRDTLERTFTLDTVTAALKLTFGLNDQHPLLTKTGSGFRRDGSYDWQIAPATNHPEILLSQQRSVIPEYLRKDLERIRKISKGRSQVFIFETPLAPNNQDFYLETPSSAALENRKIFTNTCQDLNLICFPSPARLSEDKNIYWLDAVHAPSNLLGAYLQRSVPTLNQAC